MILRLTTVHENGGRGANRQELEGPCFSPAAGVSTRGGCAALSQGERAVFPAWAVLRERVVLRQVPAVARLVGILPLELVQEVNGIASSF
jgi:hypothetical protein